MGTPSNAISPSPWPNRTAWFLMLAGTLALLAAGIAENRRSVREDRALRQLVHEQRTYMEATDSRREQFYMSMMGAILRKERLIIGLCRRQNIPDDEIQDMLTEEPQLMPTSEPTGP